jgi:hypothetical protein
VNEAAQTTVAGAGAAGTPEGTPEQTQTSEQTQTPEAAGTQEVSRRMSRKVSLEVRGFPTQEIPQDLTYHWSDEDLTHYLPEDRYLPEDLTY